MNDSEVVMNSGIIGIQLICNGQCFQCPIDSFLRLVQLGYCQIESRNKRPLRLRYQLEENCLCSYELVLGKLIQSFEVECHKIRCGG
ncbi:MAG: hypothetical protein DSY79_13285 [Chloroflexi bacterium]|nr:MAG: hypothetical protein DSY79_13285 [Chloroflexota bacterium]